METYTQKPVRFDNEFSFIGQSTRHDKHPVRILITAESTSYVANKLYSTLKGFWALDKSREVNVLGMEPELDSMIKYVFGPDFHTCLVISKNSNSLTVRNTCAGGELVLSVREGLL